MLQRGENTEKERQNEELFKLVDSIFIDGRRDLTMTITL